MKICKLKLKNLNSFREPVDIDFEKSPLDDVSLVAITGPTGSGKTTLLDAICVALYGKTPRLSGTTSQHPRHLISHGETEGFAEVCFEANSTRYHATWSIKRSGSPKGQLFDDSGELVTTKVAQEVESILGLDFGAFRRSVMLAQGEFAAFLKASNEDRRTILEATAGVHIYDILREALNRKVAEVKAVYDEVIDKLNKIPPASHEQVTGAEKELSRLQKDAGELAAQSQQILQERERETKRTEDFAKLQSSEKRQEELLDQQPKIDALQAKLENANRAQRLLPEKQAFDTAQSEFEKSEKALRAAANEKTDTEARVKTDQIVYDKKAVVYSVVSTDRDQKTPVYAAAKLDVERAEGKFADANKQMPELANLSNQIDALENQLTDRQTKQIQLQGQIDAAQRFLEDNPLPSNRQQRLTGATGLLAQLDSQEKQLETELTSKEQSEKKVLSLKREIEELSNNREKCLLKKTNAETSLGNATTELNKLLEAGTREDWIARKQQAVKAQPIAQKYETAEDDLTDSEDQLSKLKQAKAELDAELQQIEGELTNQTDVCQRAVETVQHCEEARESAMFASPINQLRQRLQLGEPCSVCGATHHPHADVVEPESEELLQNAEDALTKAKTDANDAQAQLQALKTRQAQTEQNIRNTDDQIEDCDTEIESLRNQKSKLHTQWQEIYLNIDISSDWIAEQIEAADTAIADIAEAEQTHTQASNTLQIVSQQLETCENNIAREKKSLNEIEKQLQDISGNVEDLRVTIADIETRFWDLLPDTFGGVSPKEAVKHFTDKIEEVEKRKSERDTAKTQLQVLNVNIEADQGKLVDLRKLHTGLQSEIGKYRREGEAFLDVVREKTGGLETEDEINAAIDALEANLQAKEDERGAAEQQLQSSRNLLIEKQTTHRSCENRREECRKKFATTRTAYFAKLENAGFDSLEAHDNAFRDETQLQAITDQIDAHESEKQQLALGVTELQARFEETPFDPDALGQIETQLGEIEAQIQEAQQEIGAQQQKIDDLKDALEKREALADELRQAEQEMKRWQRLQDIIPRNDLRDFALEIMFRQMGNLANGQLKYLTSDRYELKVEGIGDLSVVDRWNANEERPVETLSGGESFLTSLALALALSELSSGRAQLNSLFLDEGFGTLDTETLDIAIAALEGLRMQGRNIFLISHVQELTRRLPVKINVRKRGNGSSSVDIRG